MEYKLTWHRRPFLVVAGAKEVTPVVLGEFGVGFLQKRRGEVPRDVPGARARNIRCVWT